MTPAFGPLLLTVFGNLITQPCLAKALQVLLAIVIIQIARQPVAAPLNHVLRHTEKLSRRGRIMCSSIAYTNWLSQAAHVGSTRQFPTRHDVRNCR